MGEDKKDSDRANDLDGIAASIPEVAALSAGRNIIAHDAFLDALEGELAADRARSQANAAAGRAVNRDRDLVAEELEMQEFEEELRRDLLSIQDSGRGTTS